jgi:DNA-directed RNA polymerase specialized sigma subunit
MNNKDKKLVAHDLFMNTDKTQREISEIIGVNEKTIIRWKTEGKWEMLRSANTLTAQKIINNIYLKLEKLTNDDKLDADKIIKLANSIEKLTDRKTTLSQAINVFKEFTSFLMGKNPDLAKVVNEYQKEYITSKINEG